MDSSSNGDAQVWHKLEVKEQINYLEVFWLSQLIRVWCNRQFYLAPVIRLLIIEAFLADSWWIYFPHESSVSLTLCKAKNVEAELRNLCRFTFLELNCFKEFVPFTFWNWTTLKNVETELLFCLVDHLIFFHRFLLSQFLNILFLFLFFFFII